MNFSSAVPLIEDYQKTHDVELRNKIVLQYGDLVKVIAFSMRNMYLKYCEVDDIVNEGIIALIYAVETFSFEKNVKFETYATIKIRGAIIDFIRKQDFIPRRIRKFAKDLDNAFFTLNNSLKREPTTLEMSEYLGLEEEKYLKLLGESASVQTLSFEDALLNEKNQNYLKSNAQAEANLIDNEKTELLLASINSLKEQERLVVTLYYYEKLSFVDIASVLNISKSRVSQIHSSAITKLKSSIKNYED